MSTISYDDIGADLRRIIVSGRLDYSRNQLHCLAPRRARGGAEKSVVVDLSAVQYLASVGIGALIASAKAVTRRGGKMALVVDRDTAVMMSLHATGIDKFIPTFRKLSDAESAALG